jgi:dedicator of cytokinesis protein 3
LRRLPSASLNTPSQSFYHLVLDVHAFIANPCRPGETAELFFSLYNQAESRFITEEYCLILNHLGSPARDAEQRLGRLRTIFTDLKAEDLGSSVHSVHLVCRLIRNGAMKMRSETQSGTLDIGRNDSVRRPNGHIYSDMGTYTSSQSIAETATDDSFSATSGFAGHRTRTVETSVTATESIVDGRPTFRRPLGCAAINLPLLSKLTTESNAGVEVSMPIYAPREEAAFATLHDDVIGKKSSQLYVSSRSAPFVKLDKS